MADAWTFIANANSGQADAAWSAIADAVGDVAEVVRTEDLDDLRQALREATGTPVILGGDGSMRAAADAWLDLGADGPLAWIPAGTGNDLARTLGLPLDPLEALAVVRSGHTVALDMVVVEAGDAEVLGRGVNAVIGGGPAAANEELDPALKAHLGPLALALKQPEVLASLEPLGLTMTLDGAVQDPLDVFGLVVANGRTVGGGRVVAPSADPTDGLLDVMVMRAGDPMDVATAILALLAGDIEAHPLVDRHRCTSVAIACDGELPVSLDGDLVGEAPITVRVLPAALELVVAEGDAC